MKIEKFTDQEIVQAILDRDTFTTKEFLYKRCYPLFNALYHKYYTDCENVFEFINEIYLYILTPRKTTGRCKLADFGFRCTLTMWLKIVSEHYCHHMYAKRLDTSYNCMLDDRKLDDNNSVDIDVKSLNREDVKRILKSMPNERYRRLIELRYLHEKSNEETAFIMHLTMANYYNVHLRAKTQFREVLRKEGLL